MVAGLGGHDPNRHSAVRALIANELAAADDAPAAAGRTQRTCRAAVRTLPAMGVGVSLIADHGNPVMFAASDSRAGQIEELQFTLGEGPCLDAYTSRGPVLVSDLADATTRWPGYAPEARERGVRAVFAFPLQVGAAQLGALDVYQGKAGALSDTNLTMAFTFAEVVMEDLLDVQLGAEFADRAQQDPGDTRFEVYQAQGMITVQLGVGLAEAMARLRASAYSQNRPISQVADDVVAGRLCLEPDHI
jgi:hypothetical protein